MAEACLNIIGRPFGDSYCGTAHYKLACYFKVLLLVH